MFIRQVAYLLALDKHRHFGRAAESCHVSQPALSVAIRDLELELGITIVKRNRNFQGFTAEGERVIIWARQLEDSLHGLRQEAALIRTIPGGHLTIGTIPTAVQAASILIGQCRTLISELTFNVQSLSTSDLLRQLQKQDLDFVITYLPSDDLGIFDVQEIYAERYVLLSHRDNSLPPSLTWDAVSKLSLALLSSDMQSRQLLDREFSKLGLKITPQVQSNAVRILHEEAAAGRCCSIIPLGALPPNFSRRDMRVHKILPEHRASVTLMRLRRPTQSALSDLVWNTAKGFSFQAPLDRSVDAGA